jgi:hypothetical protein
MAKRKTKKPVEIIEVKSQCDLANDALKDYGYTFELERSQFEVLMLVETIPQNTDEFRQLNDLSFDLFGRKVNENSVRKYGTACAKTNNNILSAISKDLVKVLNIVKPYAQEA